MGILEDILAALTRIAVAQERLAADAGTGGTPLSGGPSVAQLNTLAPTPAYIPPTVQAAPQMATPQMAITPDVVTGLIQPHVANPVIKQALGDAMRAMGIAALPDTQPHQLAELYTRFQGVIAHFTGGGGQAQPAQSASII